MNIQPNLEAGIEYCKRQLQNCSYEVLTEKWQGIKIDEKYRMREALNVSFSAACPNRDDLAEATKPNLAWADAHFLERVGGLPLNPGNSYKIWPSYGQDEEMRPGKQFSHTYMERFWPKYAGKFSDLTMLNRPAIKNYGLERKEGIRYKLGDLEDLVELLVSEPLTRQAFLPVWFPEDTGAKGGRVPCTLGYHFFNRNGYFHMVYYIRSCDYFRHFRDDIYLGIKLLYWIMDAINQIDKKGNWANVKPGTFTMHITSLHIFAIEYPKLFR